MVSVELYTLIKQADLDRLKGVLTPSVILKVIGQRLLGFVNESFETRGRGRWAPLSGATLALRLRGGDAPLQDTGRYRQSFVSDVKTDDHSYVEVGSNVKVPGGASLAKIQELGITIHVKQARQLIARTRSGTWIPFGKSVTIPARPVLPTRAQAESILTPTLEAMVQRAIDGGN